MASLKRRIIKTLEREFVAGTIYRVDVDRIDVLPVGSTGIMRSLPLTGDRDKIKPGDPVRVITIAGQRVALVEDTASEDTSEYSAEAVEVESGKRTPVVEDPLVGGVSLTNHSIAINGHVALAEIAAPAAPASGEGALFMGQDSWPKAINDAGYVVPLGQAYQNLPPNTWYGTGTAIVLANNVPFVEFTDGVSDTIDTTCPILPGWKGRTLYMDVWWYPTVATGNCRLAAEARYLEHGVSVPANASLGIPVTVAASSTLIKTSFNMGTLNPTDAAQALSLRFYRAGADALDTCTGVVRVTAIALRVV